MWKVAFIRVVYGISLMQTISDYVTVVISFSGDKTARKVSYNTMVC